LLADTTRNMIRRCGICWKLLDLFDNQSKLLFSMVEN
jgi:hypothetical protein